MAKGRHSKMTPNTEKTTKQSGYKTGLLTTQKTQMDLDTFENVTLVKSAPFAAVKTHDEAMSRVNGNADVLLDAINRGLYAIEQAKVRADESIAWQEKTDDGKLVPYSGTPASPEIVNPMVLSIAKGSFGYLKAKTAEEKAAAKQQAIEAIKSTPILLNGIKAQAIEAAKAEEAEDVAEVPAA